MAGTTYGNADPATQAIVNAVDTVFGIENGAGDAVYKTTILQMVLAMLRPLLLDAVATNLITNAALFNVEEATLVATQKNAKLTLVQMRDLIHARTGQIIKLQPIAKVGATAGWVVGGGAVNTGKVATLIAGQAGSTLVLPISGLKLGTIITRFTINGSLQSAGNAVNLTAALRKLSNIAAGATDGLVEAFAAPVAAVANTKLDSANASLLLAAPYTVIADDSLYLLITSTTGAACTEEIDSIDLTVTTL